MENGKLKIFFGVVIVFQTLCGCGVEPDEDPSDMELLVGSYFDPSSSYNGISLESNDSTKLVLNPDLTYSLLFSGKTANRDYLFRIEQRGVYELSKTRYDRNCGDALCFPYLGGITMFNSESGAAWGGEFRYSKNNEVLSFPPNGIPVNTKEGFIIVFHSWSK